MSIFRYRCPEQKNIIGTFLADKGFGVGHKLLLLKLIAHKVF